LTNGASISVLGSEPLKTALIQLLSTEIPEQTGDVGLADESDPDAALGEYFEDLVYVVIRLKDPRALVPLASLLGTGNSVADAVIANGVVAVDAVIANATSPRIAERGAVMLTLAKLLTPANLPTFSDPAVLNKIKAVFTAAEADPDPFVSQFATQGFRRSLPCKET
jgi:hypothetical protein